MNILITGATGFIGKHLIARLLEEKHAIYATFREVQLSFEEKDLNWVKIPSITETGFLKEIMSSRQFDIIIHLAALAHAPEVRDEGTYYAVNTLATRNLANLAKTFRVRRFVFLSSIGAVCNSANFLVTEDTPCTPSTPYGRTKLLAEHAIREVLHDSDTDFVILRPSLVVGRGNPGNLEILGKILARKVPLPSGISNTQRSLLGVENLVEAIVRSINSTEDFKSAFILANDETLNLQEICQIIAHSKGFKLRNIYMPLIILRVLAKLGDALKRVLGINIPLNSLALAKLSSDLKISNLKFKEVSGWRPVVTTQTSLERAFS